MLKFFGCDGKTCLYVVPIGKLTDNDINIICETFSVSMLPHFSSEYVEVGPMESMESPWGSNAKSILKKCGVNIQRIEMTRLYISALFDKSKDMDKMTEMIYVNPPNFIEKQRMISNDIDISSIKEANDKYGLGFDEIDIRFYENIFNRIGRHPTLLELKDLSQSNSEHSRHWFFKGKLHHKEFGEIPESLFQMVKSTLKHIEEKNLSKRSVVSFSDNSSSIEGFEIKTIVPQQLKVYEEETSKYDITFTAETHNFPTGIAPFQGATTGTGGRIRDNQSIGRGGLVLAGTAGYCVGEIDKAKSEYSEKNLVTLLKASDGASDYGNKFGEPLVNGFCRTFGMTTKKDKRIEWVKPIMFSGGIGQIVNSHSLKRDPESGMLVCKIGGPAYRIGVGGGAASSRDQDSNNIADDMNAVQRGDAEMENKMNRVVRTCIELGEKNPIVSIHDQGAGGTGNVTKEIVYNSEKNTGALIDLSKIPVGDKSMNDLELWISEYQEQNTILIRAENQKLLEEICERENVPFAVIGVVDTSGSVTVQSIAGDIIADFPLEPILGKNIPQKEYHLSSISDDEIVPEKIVPEKSGNEIECDECDDSDDSDESDVLSIPSVGSKRFLTNKVDRSVTGLIAQQQCVGPLHTPISDYAVVAQSHFGYTGAATAIGERPLIGVYDSRAMAGMALGEMLTNLVFAQITNIHDIRISGNWMWPLKLKGEDLALYEACDELTKLCKEIGVAIDGGKDSLSMIYKDSKTNEIIPSPRQLVLSAYGPMEDIRHKITANFKFTETAIMFVDLAFGKKRMGGSSLNHMKNIQIFDVPKMENGKMIKDIIDIIQSQWFVDENYLWYTIGDSDHCLPFARCTKSKPVHLLSGHDRSDGGLFTTICEMSIAGNVGVKVNSNYEKVVRNYRSDSGESDSGESNSRESDRESNIESDRESDNGESQQEIYELKDVVRMKDNIDFWFNEELGLVFEIPMSHVSKFTNLFDMLEAKYTTQIVHFLGKTCEGNSLSFDNVEYNLGDIRMKWEKPSLELESKQCEFICSHNEKCFLKNVSSDLNIMHHPNIETPIRKNQSSEFTKPKVAIIREEGSNGDREMASAFHMAGFEVHDICMNDFLKEDGLSLDKFKGIAFVGGFSYSDVGGAAEGWYQIIMNNKNIKDEFEKFFNREDTFSLGVCNGCQLMSLLGWIPASLSQNESKRFESRFPRVEILESNAMMFKNMENSILGVWIAHGEGQFEFHHNSYCPWNDSDCNENEKSNNIVCRYVDENCKPTIKYPHNPNGSEFAAAAVCSSNGRHLAMMPHPERCFLTWQMPYKQGLILEEDETKFKEFSPWFGMFCNAYEFCTNPPVTSV